jgi:hypothetical protein
MIIFGDKQVSRKVSYILNLSNFKWEEYSKDKKSIIP